MKKILTTLACLLLVTSPSLAETKVKKVKKQPAITELTPTASAPATMHGSSGSNQIRWGVSGSIGMDDGNFGFGVGFRGDVPASIENFSMRVGGETGLYRFSPTGGSLTVIPVAVRGSHMFSFINSSDVAAFLGASLGIDIAIAKVDDHTVGALTIAGSSETKVKFHFVLEPGIEFNQNQLFASLPFGAFAGGFLLMPTIGIHF